MICTKDKVVAPEKETVYNLIKFPKGQMDIVHCKKVVAPEKKQYII